MNLPANIAIPSSKMQQLKGLEQLRSAAVSVTSIIYTPLPIPSMAKASVINEEYFDKRVESCSATGYTITYTATSTSTSASPTATSDVR